MLHLADLRLSNVTKSKSIEIDGIVDFMIERIPPEIREMKFSDFALLSVPRQNQLIAGTIFPAGYAAKPIPDRGKDTRESGSQTAVYTAVKRSRTEMEEDAKLATKIRSQLAQQSQHIILPNMSEYTDMPSAKRHQIVNILNAIVSTYEDISEQDTSN